MDAACHKLQPCSRNQVMMQLLRSEYVDQTEGSQTLTRQALAQGLCCRPKPLVCGVKDAVENHSTEPVTKGCRRS